MIKKSSKSKLIHILKNDENVLVVRQIECHMWTRTFNQLYVLNILVPICSAPQRPQSLPPLSYLDPIKFYLDT